MEACNTYTVQVPNEGYRRSWTNAEGICRRKAQKGTYLANIPEPGVAGTHYQLAEPTVRDLEMGHTW